MGGVLPIVCFEGLDLSRIDASGRLTRSSSSSSSSGQAAVKLTLIGASHTSLLPGYRGLLHRCSVMFGCAFQSALYSCHVDGQLLQELAREMGRYEQRLKQRARLPADEGEQQAGSSSGSSSGSSRAFISWWRCRQACCHSTVWRKKWPAALLRLMTPCGIC